ncbi:SdrD B-like domain-containing protein [Arenibacter lacus]|uniref:SdrD B-like domain-containing protein n=1 Tax=Arenibacter lacus TaxID=2608629 RepID=UPI00123D0C81|nr:SdrD B-like domain-containing protein [Arenibacter lacus]
MPYPLDLLRNIFPLLALLLFGMFHGVAQEKNPLEFYFKTDTVSVQHGQSFINFLILKNLSDKEISIGNMGPQQQYHGLLLSPRPSYTLKQGETKRFPIKFLANTDFMKMKSPEISYRLSYQMEGKEEELEASFFIDRKEERHIALYSFSRENFINPVQANSISLFVENRGYSQRSIKLTLQVSPSGLEVTPNERTITLEGQEKKLVEFQVAVRHQGRHYPDFNIHVRATDLLDNENVGNTYLKLMVLSNNRQVMPSPGITMDKNFVELGYNGQRSGFNYLRLKGNTAFAVHKDLQGTINMGGDYYLSEKKYNLYDTWLELENKNSVLRLGNVYGHDYDYSVSGRGGILTTRIGRGNGLEVFALENNYNLYGTYFSQAEGAKVAGAKFSFGETSDFKGKVSYVFDHNPLLNIDTQVAKVSTAFVLDSIHRISIETGLSHERGRVNQEQNLDASARINYETKLGRWEFQSLNNIAGRSYAGLSRGSFNSNQNLGYRLSGFTRLFLQYQNSEVRPQYLSVQKPGYDDGQGYYPTYFHSTQILRGGTQFSLSNWSITLAPLIEEQKSIHNTLSRNLLSYRLFASVGTSFGGHGINLSGEYSYSNATNLPWFHSARTTLSYRFQGFSLNGTAQVNPQNVIDLNYYQTGSENFLNYSTYAAYNFQTKKNSLRGAISAGLNYSELYNNTNKYLNGNLEYKISPSWAATGYGNYTQYSSTATYGFKGSNYQFRIGVKKYFVKATSAGNYNVDLRLFHDQNFNGIFDADELPIANEAIQLDNFIAITDSNGKVRFSNVPKGSYTLRVNQTKGLRMAVEPTLVVDKNNSLEIGLIKKNRVAGELIEIKQAYDKTDTYVRGVVVYVKDENGHISSTVVNQNNTFEIFLNDGTYEIYIENNAYEYINPSQKITVEGEDYPKPLIFEYKKKDTEIKVKKF